MDLQDFLPMESCLQQYCPFQQRLQRLPCYPPDTENCLSLWFWRQALLLADSWAITSEGLGTNYSSSSKASQISEMKIMVTAFWGNMDGLPSFFGSSWIPIVGDLVPIIAGTKNMICERSQSRLLQARLLGQLLSFIWAVFWQQDFLTQISQGSTLTCYNCGPGRPHADIGTEWTAAITISDIEAFLCESS